MKARHRPPTRIAPEARTGAVWTRVLSCLGLVLAACGAKNFLAVLVSGTALCPYLCPSVFPGELHFVVEPKDAGVNLLAAIEEHKEQIAERTDGNYRGAQELSGPLGAAFWSRGRYQEDGVLTEEAFIFALHPTENALLRLEYTFPAADDSSQRMQQLLEVFGEVQ